MPLTLSGSSRYRELSARVKLLRQPHSTLLPENRAGELTDEPIREADAVLMLTGSRAVGQERIVRNTRAVTDTRNATQQVSSGRETIVLA